MNTHLRFKVIATLISLSLIGLLISEGYWLKGLYDSTKDKNSENISDAMRIADYKELFIRLENLSDNNYHGEIQQNISFSKDEEEESSRPDTTELKKNDSAIESLNEYLKLVGQLEGLLQSVLHIKVDSIAPPDYARYDSLLTAELHERNIFVPHKLEVIQSGQIDSIVYQSIDSLRGIRMWDNSQQFDLAIRSNELYYHLSLQSPASLVLQQMAGILISSFLLIILILIAFIYLIYTILRQKTIEELKTDFTNNMTHELKTPISVAYAANDVLLNYTDPISDKQKKYLSIVHQQLNYLSGLVEQILTLSVENRSTFRLHPEPVRIKEVLSALVEQYSLKIGKQLNITTEIPADTIITVDRTHLYNMLSNLIENAIKYTDEATCSISISAVQVSDEICLSVSDKGIGISETNLKHIFDKFFRVPNGNLHNVKGYGLGLYYVKDMMSKHGGSVSVKSQPGKGSTFTLHFKN